MLKRILVADDGSPESMCADVFATGLAGALDARITLARVVDTDSISSVEVDSEHAKDIGAISEPARPSPEAYSHYMTAFGGATYENRTAERQGTAYIPREQVIESVTADAHAELTRRQMELGNDSLFEEPVILRGEPAEAIARKAEEGGFDMVVIATRTSGAMDRVFSGSVADEVRRSCDVPTLVINPGESPDSSAWAALPRTVIVPVPLDRSEWHSPVPAAEELARALGAPIIYAHAVEFANEARASLPPTSDSWLGERLEQAEEGLAELVDESSLRGVEAKSIMADGVAENVISDIASEYPDPIIVMHSRDTGGLERWLFGSVTDSLARKSGFPVLDVA